MRNVRVSAAAKLRLEAAFSLQLLLVLVADSQLLQIGSMLLAATESA
jgi:hypothetical protein